MGKSSKKKFYAVHKGHQTGVFEKWSEVDPLVKGFAGARYKGFETKSEAEHFATHGRELPAGSRSAAEAVKEVIQVKKSGPMKAAGSSGKMKQVPMHVAAAAMASASAATSAPGSPTLSRSALLQFTSGKASMAQAEQIPLPQPKLFAVPQPSSPMPPSSWAGSVASSPPQSSVTAVPVSPTLIPRDRLDPNTIVVSAPPKLPQDADIMSHIADANPLLPPSSRALKSAFDRAIEVDGVPPATLAGQREVPFLEYELQPGWLKVYTDGSCFGNGKGVKVAKAGIGAFFGYGDPRNISEPLALHDPTDLPSNQKAEIQAVTESLKRVRPDQDVMILTDSQYVIKAMTEWIVNWRRKKFDGVANKEYFFALEDELRKRKAKTEWKYVPGHSGMEGNEQADQLAKAGAERYVRVTGGKSGGNSKGTAASQR